MTTVFGGQLCQVSNLPHRNSVRPLRAVHTFALVTALPCYGALEIVVFD